MFTPVSIPATCWELPAPSYLPIAHATTPTVARMCFLCTVIMGTPLVKPYLPRPLSSLQR